MLKNLFILQPVAVTVLAKNKNDDIRIQLAKDRWDERVQEGSTKGVGSRTFKFRTQGDLRIMVRSPPGEESIPSRGMGRQRGEAGNEVRL